MIETVSKGKGGRPRATGPCVRCGGEDFAIRPKVTKVGGEPRTTMSRSCRDCARRLRRDAKARARERARLVASIPAIPESDYCPECGWYLPNGDHAVC
jgi:hypothetical protein